MMRLIMNGEPYVYTHNCKGNEVKGTKMSQECLRSFLIDTLYESFCLCNSYIKRINDNWSYNRINTTIMKGILSFPLKQKPDLIYKTNGNNTDIWLYVMPQKEDIALLDLDSINHSVETNRILPVLIVGDVWCFDTNGSMNINGGQYVTKYETISLLQDVNKPLPMLLSQRQLVEKVALSWQTLDARIIEPYLDKDFHYTSDVVFYEMSSRHEYMSYIRAKFNSIKNSSNSIRTRIGKLGDSNEFALLLHQGLRNQDLLLLITTHEGRITSMRMCEYES